MNREFEIKGHKVRNRFAIPPMVCFYWSDDNGYVTKKHIEHYKDLAAGGAGIVIVEATAITKRSRLHQTELGLWEDGQIEGFKEITRVIHEGGALALIQLVNAGGNGIDPEAEAPSTMDYRGGHIHAHEMSKDRIEATVDDFVKASLRAKEAGFDGVELHGCHSYLLSCFFSSKTNKREDEYGKDKSLLAKEVLTTVKKAVPEDFIVGIRLAAFEPKLEDGIEHAKAIAEYTDFLDVSYGVDSEGFTPEGFKCSQAVYGAMCIKKELPNMPVFGVHNINSKEDVINALETGIDMVDIGKASLVDPAFPKHVLDNDCYGQCLHCKGYCRWNPDKMADEKAVCPGYVKYQRSLENK